MSKLTPQNVPAKTVRPTMPVAALVITIEEWESLRDGTPLPSDHVGVVRSRRFKEDNYKKAQEPKVIGIVTERMPEKVVPKHWADATEDVAKPQPTRRLMATGLLWGYEDVTPPLTDEQKASCAAQEKAGNADAWFRSTEFRYQIELLWISQTPQTIKYLDNVQETLTVPTPTEPEMTAALSRIQSQKPAPSAKPATGWDAGLVDRCAEAARLEQLRYCVQLRSGEVFLVQEAPRDGLILPKVFARGTQDHCRGWIRKQAVKAVLDTFVKLNKGSK